MLRKALCLILPAIVACGSVKPPISLKSGLEWHLNGGAISGGFVPLDAKKDWPLWMQALVGGRRDVSASELKKADLYKVPDASLVGALEMLRARQVFTGKLLRQVSGIMHAAEAVAFQKAKTAYQKDYVAAMGLPVEDMQTCSRVMTQLKNEGYESLVASSLNARPFPAGDAALQASFKRMIFEKPSREAVLDKARPEMERLYFLTKLRMREDVLPLLNSFRGTRMLDRAVYYAVEEEWINIRHPLVQEACESVGQPWDGPWFMVRPIERASDLGWMRAMDALRRSDPKVAINACQTLLKNHTDSYYAGHAAAMLSALSPKSPTPALNLRVPADVTLFNATTLKRVAKPLSLDWPEEVKPLVDKNRFDLILIAADPEKQTDLYLKAAHACGQIDLIGRFLSVERKFGPDTFTSSYPVYLEDFVRRILKEEGADDVVDPAFVMAMMKNESLFQPIATSGSMAYGLLQLLKPTFRAMMGSQADIRHPESNIRGGIRYYDRIAKAAGLRGLPAVVRQAYIAVGYHAGEGRAKRWKNDIEAYCRNGTDYVNSLYRIDSMPIRSTRNYVTRVLGDAEVYRVILDRKAGKAAPQEIVEVPATIPQLQPRPESPVKPPAKASKAKAAKIKKAAKQKGKKKAVARKKAPVKRRVR